MRACIAPLATVLILAASSAVLASVTFTGPGWYLEDADQTVDNVLVSGPYSDQQQCEAVRPADTDDDQYLCLYEKTDPAASAPPRELSHHRH